MARNIAHLFLFVCLIPPLIFAAHDYKQTCLDAKYHLRTPQKASELHQQCSPWKHMTCCTNQTAYASHLKFSGHYKFNYDHCKNMSEKCMQHFTKNNCFYECSPNLGPWIEQTKSSFRKEKIASVPLCESNCNNWWNDCKDEMTCVMNWSKDFEFNETGNRCPNSTNCQSFTDIFHNATFFCEHIYEGDYKVTADKEQCMKLWFDGDNENPNDKVAEYYADLKYTVVSTTPFTATTTTVKTTFNSTLHPNHSRVPFATKNVLGPAGTAITIAFASIVIICAIACTAYHLYLRYFMPSYQGGVRNCAFLRRLIGQSISNQYIRTQADEQTFIDYDDEVIEEEDDLNPHGTLQVEL